MEAVGIKVGFPAYICRVADSGLLGLVYNIGKIFQIAFQTFLCDNFYKIQSRSGFDRCRKKMPNDG